ncbi:MAG: PCI domain-containing protein [archaeon]|nr:PCI domain-containing protein [archaeon]
MTHVVQNQTFIPIVQANPLLHGFLRDFFNFRFPQALRSLSTLLEGLAADLHCFNLLSTLRRLIVRQAIIRYTSAFSTIDLHKMAADFSLPLDTLEEALVSLIQQSLVSGKIDAHACVYRDHQPDTHEKMISDGIAAADHLLDHSETQVLQMSWATFFAPKLSLNTLCARMAGPGGVSDDIDSGDIESIVDLRDLDFD